MVWMTPRKGSGQECNPGELIPGGRSDSGSRPYVGRVIVRSPRDQFGTDASEEPGHSVSPLQMPPPNHVLTLWVGVQTLPMLWNPSMSWKFKGHKAA
jgi:hypothetical protein